MKKKKSSSQFLSLVFSNKGITEIRLNRLYIPSLATASIPTFFLLLLQYQFDLIVVLSPFYFFLFLTFSISIQFDCIRLFTYVIDFINGFLCFLAHHIKRSLFDRIVRVQFPHSFSLVNEYHTKYYFQFSFLNIS